MFAKTVVLVISLNSAHIVNVQLAITATCAKRVIFYFIFSKILKLFLPSKIEFTKAYVSKSEACSLKPCKNGARCESLLSGYDYYCHCTGSYMGKNCDKGEASTYKFTFK